MEDKEIYQKIEETYNTEKGKNFITHLLRSFLPMHKSSRMFSNEKNLRMRDCVTGENLCTVNDNFAILASEEGMSAFMDNIRTQLNASLEENKTTYEYPDSVKKLRDKLKPIAIVCDKSDKVISEQTIQQLFNFFATELLKENKHIKWVANNERGKEFIKAGKRDGFVENKREEKVVKKVIEHAKISLGDFEVLQKLRDKLNK